MGCPFSWRGVPELQGWGTDSMAAAFHIREKGSKFTGFRDNVGEKNLPMREGLTQTVLTRVVLFDVLRTKPLRFGAGRKKPRLPLLERGEKAYCGEAKSKAPLGGRSD